MLPMIRDDIKQATVQAMKAGEKQRTAALRLIAAKIKDRDIEQRTSGKDVGDDDLVIEVLQKMAKQRRESIQMYEDGGRDELAQQERDELVVIEEFLPQTMDEAQTMAAIESVKADLGATSIKDMGRVMAELKSRHGATLDMAKASGWVKGALA
ncbi:aspartyl-tRNA amidotransferase subunit B [Pelagerythrobacter marensis]|uniref:Aspartyl-tRNA amidotransferase subunit B n=2 Tax=Pelagerythrobacter marensis TaxID=543877 RepID=A0A0G3X8G4_9SPHN|nr:aspartyl-tRNA amidotransferase subunit B [Pelagerythrobacter marensis]